MPDLEEQTGASGAKDASKAREEVVSEEEIESEVELDTEGVVTPDNDAPQKMGDPSVEVTDEMRDSAQIAKSKALEAIASGDLDEAVSYFTEAILCNPTSALMYANRAGVYVKMKKPNAAIRDAEAAIRINPDYAKGYKWRGEAKALLGQWEEAAKDLHLASSLDYDEKIAAILKKVEPNPHKIEEHRRKYELLRTIIQSVLINLSENLDISQIILSIAKEVCLNCGATKKKKENTAITNIATSYIMLSDDDEDDMYKVPRSPGKFHVVQSLLS